MTVVVFPVLIVLALLFIAVVLPSKRDTSVAAWWARVCYQVNFSARAVLAVACLAGIVWFVVLPLFGWGSMGR